MKTVIHVQQQPEEVPQNRNFLVGATDGDLFEVDLADDGGNKIDFCPHLLYINKRGHLVRNQCVNEEIAKQYGIELDYKGRIVLED